MKSGAESVKTTLFPVRTSVGTKRDWFCGEPWLTLTKNRGARFLSLCNNPKNGEHLAISISQLPLIFHFYEYKYSLCEDLLCVEDVYQEGVVVRHWPLTDEI